MKSRFRFALFSAAVWFIAYQSTALAQPAAETAVAASRDPAFDTQVHYRTVTIDGIDVFYREAGSADAPALLLLHGFPASSFMYRDLIARLSDRFRVIAPDYPGFGYSDAPSANDFAYTFDHLADIIEKFIRRVGVGAVLGELALLHGGTRAATAVAVGPVTVKVVTRASLERELQRSGWMKALFHGVAERFRILERHLDDAIGPLERE